MLHEAAFSYTQPIISLPKILAKGFPKKRLDPIRAGITPIKRSLPLVWVIRTVAFFNLGFLENSLRTLEENIATAHELIEEESEADSKAYAEERRGSIGTQAGGE